MSHAAWAGQVRLLPLTWVCQMLLLRPLQQVSLAEASKTWPSGSSAGQIENQRQWQPAVMKVTFTSKQVQLWLRIS
jgi:hypothetical protein